MGDIATAQEVLGGQSFLNIPLIEILAIVFVIAQLVNYGYKIFMTLYNKKNGTEKKEKSVLENIEDLSKSIKELKEIHENDIKRVQDKEKTDYAELKAIIKETAKKQEEELSRSAQADQAILRSDIIRICKESQKAYWIVSPTDKENLDKLFAAYYGMDGNGLIKDLEKVYRENVHVDYDLL